LPRAANLCGYSVIVCAAGAMEERPALVLEETASAVLQKGPATAGPFCVVRHQHVLE
jgi:hypothetical protein